eukprot:7834609-Pyramimonas_sp.AAC.1
MFCAHPCLAPVTASHRSLLIAHPARPCLASNCASREKPGHPLSTASRLVAVPTPSARYRLAGVTDSLTARSCFQLAKSPSKRDVAKLTASVLHQIHAEPLMGLSVTEQ